MDNEATEIVSRYVNQIKQKDYAELKALAEKNESLTYEEQGKQDDSYTVSIRVWYDDKKSGTIRVSGAVYSPKKVSRWNIFSIDKSLASDGFLIKQNGEIL